MPDDHTITLPDGRSLGYRLLGDPAGRPLFYFHGTPGSRLELSAEDPIARLPGVRLVLPERPGYGLSDPQPSRTLLDWPDDVAALADHLGVDAFAVAGVSGGGPHALACAYRLPWRVTRALVLSSPAPADFRGATRGMSFGNRLGIWLGRYAPGLLRRLIESGAAAFAKDPDGFVRAMARQMAPPDRGYFEDEAFRAAFARDLREAYRQGSEGQLVDGALAMSSRSWGFPLEEISVPVDLWHGEDDVLVTLAMARRLAREIPDCRARYVPGAGHLLAERPEVVEEVGAVLGEGSGRAPD